MAGKETTYLHGTHRDEQRRLTRMQELLNGASLRQLRLAPEDRVLEMGLGLAHFARAMARTVGSRGHVLGIEASAEQLEEAQRLARADGEHGLVEMRQGDATDPPLADDEWGSFDVAHARFLLEHVSDPAAVVRAMVRAVRPGGRIVLEDDDHADLRLHPEPEGFGDLWRAYMRAYDTLGADPFVGRHLVTLLDEAGAEPVRTHCLFFGGCAGQPTFPLLVENFIGIIEGARETMVGEGLIEAPAFDAALDAFREWGRRPDAAMWYSTCWAEGRRATEAEAVVDAESAPSPPADASSSDPAPSPPADVASSEPALPPAAFDENGSLQMLIRAARDLNATLEMPEVLRRVADRVKSLINCHLFCVLLWDEESELLEHSFSMRFGEHVDLGNKGGFPLGYGIGGTAAATRRPVRVPDVRVDPRYVRFRHAEVDIRSELAVPLIVKDRLIGVVDLESMDFDAFTLQHEQLLSALAAHIATALENARLYEQVRSHDRRLHHELSVAREIQTALLPEAPPRLPGLDIGTSYTPARQVGGDFFDFRVDTDGRLSLAVGDVAGKATPAALYGAMAIGLLRADLANGPYEPAKLVASLNEQLCRMAVEGRFLAMSLAVVEPGSRALTLVNAGLPRPFLLREGRVERVALEGLALGIESEATYADQRLTLAPGDVLVLCSDGFEEARASNGEPFGGARLQQCLERCEVCSAQDIADALRAATEEWTVASDREVDDRTAVVLRAV